MKIHVLVDFMHIYYKYYFQLKAGKLKRLTAPMDWNGSVIEKDVTLIYMPMKDIEGIRKGLESIGHDVTMSICFDMPSKRKDEGVAGGEEYKSGRTNRLTEEDFKNIQFIQKTLSIAGHNTYRYEGYEADDIVNYMVRTYKDEFDYTVIYTNDKDLLINIDSKVGAMRFKQGKGYSQVDLNNYEEYLEPEFKTYIPYNMLGLYLASAGDSADHIKGINKFGPKAFSKLLTKVCAKNEFDKRLCGDYDYLTKVVKMCEEFLTPEQFTELQQSFALVANIELIDDVPAPTSKSTYDLRQEAYGQYKMISLIP